MLCTRTFHGSKISSWIENYLLTCTCTLFLLSHFLFMPMLTSIILILAKCEIHYHTCTCSWCQFHFQVSKFLSLAVSAKIFSNLILQVRLILFIHNIINFWDNAHNLEICRFIPHTMVHIMHISTNISVK